MRQVEQAGWMTETAARQRWCGVPAVDAECSARRHCLCVQVVLCACKLCVVRVNVGFGVVVVGWGRVVRVPRAAMFVGLVKPWAVRRRTRVQVVGALDAVVGRAVGVVRVSRRTS